MDSNTTNWLNEFETLHKNLYRNPDLQQMVYGISNYYEIIDKLIEFVKIHAIVNGGESNPHTQHL